ncbi:pre-rRNA processing protein [Ceratocystis pirilliformis]|uniref:Pre-rRNA processing protein n=1 Tax=Ceratocystis pirilliformis TaxID=259994 RepID=A0ABR3YYI8_9PEZI
MSSFFTVPGQKKRKRAAGADSAQKRTIPTRFKPTASTKNKSSSAKQNVSDDDESISGSDSEMADSAPEDAEDSSAELSSEEEGETGAERRLRLAERYLENIKEQVDTIGFDAAEIDRDMIAERLQEDVAESKGKVYRNLVEDLAFDQASHTLWKANTLTFTSIAVHEPFAYTVTKDMYLQKWRVQDLPQNQFPQTTRRKPRKPPAPPRKKPTLVSWIRGDRKKAKDKEYKRHVGEILCVAVSPDGQFVATGGADRRLIIYNAETLTPLRVFTHHRDSVTGLAFRRGTNQLFSSSKDRTVKVWSLNELAYVETLFGHQDDVVDVAALAQERCVSVGSRDRTARLWKVAEESQLVFRGGSSDKKKHHQSDPAAARIPHEGTMDRVAMIDDELFVTGSDNGSLSLWSVAKKKPLSIVPVAHGFEPRLLPTEASAEIDASSSVVPDPCPRYITALCTVPYSDLVLSGSWDGYIRVWQLSDDKRTLEPVGVLGDSEPVVDDQDTEKPFLVKGVINDIDLFERGDRGKDGLCVVAAVGKEHRFGRWKVITGGRNGGVIFEIPRGALKSASTDSIIESSVEE